MLNWLTGGRPMRKVCFCFTDMVSGEPVSMWLDGYGRLWLATGAWSVFRIEPQYGPEIWESAPDEAELKAQRRGQ